MMTDKSISPTRYDMYWSTKGQYGAERVLRKNIRKAERAESAKAARMCKCGINEKDSRSHTCPYDEDMFNAGGTSSCRCCDRCKYECGQDI